MASKRTRYRRIVGMLLAACAAVLALILALCAWLIGSESGARAVLSALPVVSTEGVHGRLAGPLHIDHLSWERTNQRIVLENVELEWDPPALMHGLLHVRSLLVSRMTVTSKIEQQPRAPKIPDDIALPIALQIDQVQIDGGDLSWGPLALVKLGAFGFALDFDRKRYRLRLNRFSASASSESQSAAGYVSGQAMLDVVKPYALHADFSSNGSATIAQRAITGNGNVALDGSLAGLAADFNLTINQSRVQGHAVVQPFSEQPLTSTNVGVRALDLSAFGSSLPHTALDGKLAIPTGGAGQLALSNRDAGLYNDGRLPLIGLQASIKQDAGKFMIEQFSAALGSAARPAGTIRGSGRYGDGALTLALAAQALDLRRLDGRAPATALAGNIGIRQAAGGQQFTLDLKEPVGKQHASLSANGMLSDTRIAIERAELRLGGGHVQASGHADLSNRQSFDAEGKVNRLRLQQLGRFAQLPELDLSGSFSLHGARHPALIADLAFQLNDSLLAGHPLQGDGVAHLRGDRITVPQLFLAAGDNRLDVHGELSQGDAQLSFALTAPRLEQLGRDFAGTLNANGVARGKFAQPRIAVAWQGNNLRMPQQWQVKATQGKADFTVNRALPLFIDIAALDATARGFKNSENEIESLAARVQFARQANAPLAIDMQIQGIATPQLHVDSFNATAQGTTTQHTITVKVIESGNKQSWTAGAQGALLNLAHAPRWQGAIERFDAAGRFIAHLAAPAALSLSPQQVQLDRFTLDANSATIAVEQFVRDARGIATRGRINRLQLAQLLKFGDPQTAIATDLRLAGDWDVRIGKTVEGSIRMRRLDGDVVMRSGTPVALGLSRLDASAIANGNQLTLQLNADGQQLGHIGMNARTDTTRTGQHFAVAPDAPVAGSAIIDIPSLAWAGPMLSPTVVSEGRILGEITLSGTYAQPNLNGRIGGSGLRLFAGELGLDLRQGVLDSEFNGNTLSIRNLAFQGASGSVTASGSMHLSGNAAQTQIALKAEQFALLNRSDRKLTVSGTAQLGWRDNHATTNGSFAVDSGFFDIGREDMPQLSDDVVVVGRNQKATDRVAASVDIDVDLGSKVTLKGRGLDATLAGRLHLAGKPNTPLRAQGTVRIAQGTYTAYNRKLAIEQGVLRFSGALNNPALDILAMRRGQEVEAGVAVRGTVLAPRVSLVSEPPAPEAEKLSWLVLGHALDSAGSGDLGVLQSAAGALLSQSAAGGVQSHIATAFGLDEFSIGSNQDNSLQQRIVTLGKRLSSRLYVSYEQSLQTATSVVLFHYTLSPRLTVEAEAGTRSALSLLYNVAFD